MMTRFLTTAGLLALGASALSAAAFAGDDDYQSQSYEFEGFSRIEVAGVYDLQVEVGKDFTIEVSGRQKEMDLVEVGVDGDTLVLDHMKRKWGGGNRKGVEATITLPSLSALAISGVVDADIEGIDSPEFSVKLSGVGDVELEGECGVLDAKVSGVGELDADKLECRDVEVKVSGVGEANVYASDSVDASVSGMGEINVSGSPKDVSKSGGMFSNINVR